MATAKKKAPTVADVLASATLVEKIVPICVAGHLVGEHERLEAELEQVRLEEPLPGARLGAPTTVSRAAEIARKIKALEEQMREATFEFVFRALTPKAWSDLIAAHPDNKRKDRLFDLETLPPAAIAACCVAPEGMDDPEKVAELMERLSAAQQADLFNAAWAVNQDAPKGRTSSAASAVLRAYEMSLRTASPTESPAPSS